MARRLFIVANWKMNPESLGDAQAIIKELKRKTLRIHKPEVIICPPAVFLSSLYGKSPQMLFGSQDVSPYPGSGAFTGELSSKQLKAGGAKYAILGHSERRLRGDTDEIVAQKIVRACEAGLKPIVCVGEKERDAQGAFLKAIELQLEHILRALPRKKTDDLLIAYEPLWAIGSGATRSATANEAREIAIFIRKVLTKYMVKARALKVPILYGGSVSEENALEFLKIEEMNGLLVGRTSLYPELFTQIIKTAHEIRI